MGLFKFLPEVSCVGVRVRACVRVCLCLFARQAGWEVHSKSFKRQQKWNLPGV